MNRMREVMGQADPTATLDRKVRSIPLGNLHTTVHLCLVVCAITYTHVTATARVLGTTTAGMHCNADAELMMRLCRPAVPPVCPDELCALHLGHMHMPMAYLHLCGCLVCA